MQDFSRDLFLCVFVRVRLLLHYIAQWLLHTSTSLLQECGPVAQKGIVVGILDKAFDVLVVEFGVTKRIYTEV